MIYFINKIFKFFLKIIKYSFLFFICINLLFIITSFFSSCNSNSKLKKFDIIIVLGIPATNDCKPGQVMKNRVKKGVELYQLGLANKILFTGSSVRNNCYEAEVMASLAKSLGVPDYNIILENKAKNTYENAYYSISKMKNLNCKLAAIVTSQAHIKRSCVIFSKFDIGFKTFATNKQKNISTPQLLFWNMGEKMILTYHMIFGFPKIMED